ncbi:MAG: STAS domain-containing protein [Gemmatimonadales bacterium]
MNISTTQENATALVRLGGRLDGEAALQVADTLDRLLREGRRSVVLDMSGVTYLSSPGTLVLQRAYQDYASARGELHIASPPQEVADTLTLAGLLPRLLVTPPDDRSAVDLPSDATRDDWRVPEAQATRGTYEVSTRDPNAELGCRVHGHPDRSVRTWIDSSDYRGFEFPETAFGVGIGALSATREQAAPRLGEIVGAAGAVAHLPSGKAQVPDFDVGLGQRSPRVQLVSGLVCDGGFSLLKRFSSAAETEPIPLSELAQVALEGVRSDSVGVVMVAETTGLVGAWLRRSPGIVLFSMYLDVHGIRDWLGTTPRPVHPGTTVLVAGVVSRRPDPLLATHLRPIAPGSDLHGHFHAVAFAYRPVPQRTVVLRALVTRLFTQQSVLGVLHLFGDDRGAAGAGESGFRRGLCWSGPITQVTVA